MERDYLELSELTCISYPFPYTSQPSPFGTIEVLRNGIRAIDLEMTKSSCNSSSFHWIYIQRWRSFLATSQALWILCSRKHATTSHVFYCLLLHVRRGVGIFSRCAGIGIMHKLGGFHIHYKTGFEHQSLMHQRRLSPKNPRCISPWISCRETQNQFFMHR